MAPAGRRQPWDPSDLPGPSSTCYRRGSHFSLQNRMIEKLFAVISCVIELCCPPSAMCPCHPCVEDVFNNAEPARSSSPLRSVVKACPSTRSRAHHDICHVLFQSVAFKIVPAESQILFLPRCRTLRVVGTEIAEPCQVPNNFDHTRHFIRLQKSSRILSDYSEGE